MEAKHNWITISHPIELPRRFAQVVYQKVNEHMANVILIRKFLKTFKISQFTIEAEFVPCQLILSGDLQHKKLGTWHREKGISIIALLGFSVKTGKDVSRRTLESSFGIERGEEVERQACESRALEASG
ncbi:hypothetical protein M5K25_027677 [Dendrobium thyrsiflorum]|uniref:Uncharacterized protein n=1 Tax=Dendrobium thyrsiflorum TaxID=117978 RepID=A0ABD0TUE7_DENTH